MEWEAILMRFPDRSPEDIPSDWRPPGIGRVEEVQSLLESSFPDAEHTEGLSVVRGDGYSVEFDYDPCEEGEDILRAIAVHSDPGPGAVPVLKLAAENLNCRLLDLQAGEFADFGRRTEASFNDFIALRRRLKRQQRWAFGATVTVVMVLHGLQDAGVFPARQRLSKLAIASYGLVGLLILNAAVFLSSVVIAIGQARRLKAETKTQEEQDEIEEAILVPAFQGKGFPPSFIVRYLHIAVGGLIGMIAGSILAWGVWLVFF